MMATIDFGELTIHYREAGEGETLLVFPDDLHASAGYEEELSYFAERFHVLIFDYPGKGGSTREERYPDELAFDPWGFRADLACHLLLALEIPRAYALGVGGGALAALHFAGKQASDHDLEALGIVADSFLADLDSRTLHRALDVREHYYVRNARSLQRQHGDDWREVVDADTRFWRRIADRGGYAVRDCILNAIACPVLLTGHQRDPRTPGIAREFARLAGLIPDCTLYLASSARHPYIEYPFLRSDPETFRRLVDLFLEGARA
jgi:pimeloyl-ACP methyl ester carboxylesterase